MIRKFSVFILSLSLLFISQCGFKNQIPISYGPKEASFVWPSEDLKKEFIRYWTLRSDKRHEETFKMEAPYLQEIVPASVYRSYVAGKGPRIERLQLFRTDMETSDACVVSIKLFFGKDDNHQKGVSLKDQWVNVGGKWYHIIKDPVMRKFFP